MKTILNILSGINTMVGKYPTLFVLVVGLLPYLQRCNDQRAIKKQWSKQMSRILDVEFEMSQTQRLEDSIRNEQNALYNQFLQSQRLIDSAFVEIGENSDILKRNKRLINYIKEQQNETNFKDSSINSVLQFLPE